MENLKRTFISIELPTEIVDYLFEVQKKLEKEKFFAGKLTERENLHLTVKFLGEISDEEIELIREALREINFERFNVKLGKLGVFSSEQVRIIWIDLEGKEIFELQKQIDEKLKNFFPKEKRFMCHITIARVKKVFSKAKLFEFLEKFKPEKINFSFDNFCLKESKLTPGGPVYSDLERFVLG